MNQNEREQFFSDQVTQGDFETTTGYTRHRLKGMTAQYLNECVDKRNGMEVADKDGEVWGWVYDCHKSVGKWVSGDTHDRRVKGMSEGMGQPCLLRDYEPYRYVSPLENFPDDPTGYDPSTWEESDDSDDDWSDCEPITGGITVTGDQSPYLDPTYYTDHAHIPVNDPVNPNHYQGFSNGAEVIDITENLTFSAGNAVKYLSRAGRIDGQNKGSILEDLRKAAWYVAREIDRIEAQK